MMATSAPPSWWPTMFLSKITRQCWQSRLKSGKTNFWHKLVKFYETGQQDDLNNFLYKTSIGIMPGGLTMEKTREIEERNRKWLGLE
ncbi:hypothetical protein ACXO18_04750 [Lactobacillus delbrueckii subsp. bulgaricus]